MPYFLFEYVETKDAKPFQRRGTYSINGLINKSEYFHDLENIRSFMFDLLTALDYIHSKGIMHRDIKPSNLMLNKDNELRIIDFDLASHYFPDSKMSYHVGTPGYGAPEI